MTFDSNISEDISLSKILDCFIVEDESPSVILNFLNEHFEDSEDILKYSDYSERIFQLDFVAKCSNTDLMNLYKLISNDKISYEERCYFLWQIFQTNLSDYIKNIFKPLMVFNNNIKHPYSGLSSNVKQLDYFFKDKDIPIDDIVFNINRIRDDKFETLIKHIDKSLWLNRIYQIDFFGGLEITKQYILIKNLSELLKTHYVYNYRKRSRNIFKFIKQIISDGSIDSSVKEMIYEMFSNNSIRQTINEYIEKIIGRETKEQFYSYDNFGEMIINLNIVGIDFIGEYIALMLFVNHRKNILKEWCDYDVDYLKNNIDMVEWLSNE